MDTQEIMMAHIKAREKALESVRSWAPEDTKPLYNARLDELSLILEVLRNANNLARLANPEITFSGKAPE